MHVKIAGKRIAPPSVASGKIMTEKQKSGKYLVIFRSSDP